MTIRTVHVRGQLPWLRSGPLHRVHTSAAPVVAEMLAREAFTVVELDGRMMTSVQQAHRELARGFGFPDYYGSNWDAFNDCLWDFAEEHNGGRVAVTWSHVETAAASSPLAAIEVGWALLDSALGWTRAIPAEGSPTMQMEIFAVGEGDDFDRPSG